MLPRESVGPNYRHLPRFGVLQNRHLRASCLRRQDLHMMAFSTGSCCQLKRDFALFLRSQDKEVAVVVSFLEIYCDQVRDLGEAYMSHGERVVDGLKTTSDIYRQIKSVRRSAQRDDLHRLSRMPLDSISLDQRRLRIPYLHFVIQHSCIRRVCYGRLPHSGNIATRHLGVLPDSSPPGDLVNLTRHRIYYYGGT